MPDSPSNTNRALHSSFISDASSVRGRHGRCDSLTSLLLFDLELEDGAPDAEGPLISPRYPKLQNLLASLSRYEQVLAHAQQARDAAFDGGTEEVNLDTFAAQLASHGYLCWLRTGWGSSSSDALGAVVKHRFLVLAEGSPGALAAEPAAGYGGGDLVIVDPCFKEQFELACATEEYRELVGLLPDVIIANAKQIDAICRLLCQEMEVVFMQRGVPLPPWRTHAAMVSRWLVSAAQDVLVTLPGSEAHAAVQGEEQLHHT
mmetsp:Transcript_30077/g.66628  ORF Transcript_30077/g.66628 Transcript_30077/m.66628 type:complete len:260 (-) Transcript_30077:1233-2012(-)